MSSSDAITAEVKDVYKKVSFRKSAGVILKYNDDGTEVLIEKEFAKAGTFDEMKENLPKLECRYV